MVDGPKTVRDRMPGEWMSTALASEERGEGLANAVAHLGRELQRIRTEHDKERADWDEIRDRMYAESDAVRTALGRERFGFSSLEKLARGVVAERDQLKLEAQAQRRRADEAEKRAATAEAELAKIASKARETCPQMNEGVSAFGALCIALAELEAARAAMAVRDAKAGKPKRRKGR